MLFHIGRRLSGGLSGQAASLSSAQLNLLKEEKIEIPVSLKQNMQMPKKINVKFKEEVCLEIV